ncbi:MAG: hypothetical protein L0H93_08095 [Nocardioides sp.]|nr:hypothetical protein [Nocardioides sp.]
MTNPYLSFVRRKFAVIVVGVLVAVSWSLVDGPLLDAVSWIMGAPAMEAGDRSAAQLLRFTAGVLLLAAIPMLAYLGWMAMMGPDGTRGVGPWVRSLTMWAVIVVPLGVALALLLNLDRAPPFLSGAEPIRFAYRRVALEALGGGGQVVGDAMLGAAVSTTTLLVLGIVGLCLAPLRRHPVWWRLAVLPAGAVGLWVGLLPYVD